MFEEEHPTKVSTATMSRRIRDLPGGRSLKKRPLAPQSATKSGGQLFRERAGGVDLRLFVWVDECAAPTFHEAPLCPSAQRGSGPTAASPATGARTHHARRLHDARRSDGRGDGLFEGSTKALVFEAI